MGHFVVAQTLHLDRRRSAVGGRHDATSTRTLPEPPFPFRPWGGLDRGFLCPRNSFRMAGLGLPPGGALL